MSRGGQVLKQLGKVKALNATGFQVPCITGATQQTRHIGGGVPEFFGRPSHYTEGTDFLGTPKEHLELTKKRPLSPDVFDIDGKRLHYDFPINATSSIINRATGVALSIGMVGAGGIALVGDLPSAVLALRDSAPALVIPLKALVAFPFVYHYAGGLRHLVWEFHKIGNQADKTSLLENAKVDQSSRLVIGASVLGTLGLALLTV